MKLVMKADDGKEIVYLSGNNYDVGAAEEIENTLIVDVSKIDIKYKNYLDVCVKNNTAIDFSMKKKEDEYILETPDYYFIFDKKLDNIIREEVKINTGFRLAIGHGIKVEGGEFWSIFSVGVIKNAN